MLKYVINVQIFARKSAKCRTNFLMSDKFKYSNQELNNLNECNFIFFYLFHVCILFAIFIIIMRIKLFKIDRV